MSPIALLIDTSTDPVVASFDQKGNCIGHQTEKGGKAGNLENLLERHFADYSLDFHEIEAILAANGPGSFTGLRVGLAFVQGLCFPNNTPVFPFSSLYPGLTALDKKEPGGAVIQAKQGYYYLASNVPKTPGFTSETMISTEDLLKLSDQLSTLVTTGNIRDYGKLENQFKKMVSLDGVYPHEKVWSYARQQPPVTNGIIRANYVQLPAAEARRLKKKSVP